MGKKKNKKQRRISSIASDNSELRLNDGTRDVEGLEVHVEGHDGAYVIPSINALSLKDVMAFRKVNKLPKKMRSDAYADAFYELCIRYVPREAIDSLTLPEFAQLVEAWNSISEGGGVGPGE